ncbi:MAG: ORF6N domain-containing protein [Candidatus Omnitrophica bacterium]|nr:ORF6N domain-containing protein [Candidatus Omnitrophota bacterium]
MITERIEQRILLIRGKKVMLDRDLAALYQVPTFRLNEQVKRNIRRFPDDFMFQLSHREKKEVIANCDNLQELKFSHTLPYAFTEHGIAMLSSILNSDKAIEVNIQIMRTFGKLRELMLVHKDLRFKIEEMEKKYDQQFKIVFDAIRELLAPPPPPKPKIPIGFHAFQKSGEKSKLKREQSLLRSGRRLGPHDFR